MTPGQVQQLEAHEEELKQPGRDPNKFIIPGDTRDGAALDLLARSFAGRNASVCACSTRR